MPYVKRCRISWQRMIALISLCLMMLSGCNATPSNTLSLADFPLPENLLMPCQAPVFDVHSWGDYPDYVARLSLTLDKCNSDKKALLAIFPLINAATKEN